MVETRIATERRAYVRVPLLADGEDGVLITAAGDEHPLELRLRNLSAGGIGAYTRFRVRGTDVVLQVGDELRFGLRLPNQEEPVQFRARLAWSKRAARGEWFTWQLGAAFLDVPPKLREILIHWVLEIQRRHIRLGLR